ncbi:uncharacterized protein LOC121394513 [Xenopus laevis]|uniref:phospholipase A2 n=2 Tax=Xenopus laevis TaxID=8355 RepID=A0A974I560_XENLA|nr:uncharacterized protein LOC121394513 [Xenopus laevis]OCU01599.1 hypothetical protein XELAEV_18007390mg [Xenopus laevis]
MAARMELGISVLLVGLLMISDCVTGKKAGARYKRGLTMPGTLWCGAGSSADNFTNLGIFNGADLCCREHDHCSHQIEAFQFLYGMRNYRLHTVSHCDCDQRFRLCLHALNDTISTLVGIMFFNILEMPCFSLKEEEQCMEWFWWGGCKKSDLVPKAELQKQAVFNYTHPSGLQASIASLHGDTLAPTSPRYTQAPLVFSTVFGGIAKKRRRLLKNKLQGYTFKGFQKFRERDSQKNSERDNQDLPDKANLIPKVSNVHTQKHKQKWTEINSLRHTDTLSQEQGEAIKAQQIGAESALALKTKVSKDSAYRDMEEETLKHKHKEKDRSKRKQRARRMKKQRRSSPGKTRNLINNPSNGSGEVTPMYRAK